VHEDGTSCFLLNEAQKTRLIKNFDYECYRDRAKYSGQFASLSPIELPTEVTLTDIFREYNVKAGKRTNRANAGVEDKNFGRGIVLYEHSR
jgi:hypothetical protein